MGLQPMQNTELGFCTSTRSSASCEMITLALIDIGEDCTRLQPDSNVIYLALNQAGSTVKEFQRLRNEKNVSAKIYRANTNRVSCTNCLCP